MNDWELISQLLADGWEHVATHGSYWQFKHPTKPGMVTVPHPKARLTNGNGEERLSASEA